MDMKKKNFGNLGIPKSESKGRSVTDMLASSKKSKGYTSTECPDYFEDLSDCILGMLTVKAGTAEAGGLCNLIMEVARNYKLDLEASRKCSDSFQREALDSKSTMGGLYTEANWYKLVLYSRSLTGKEPKEEVLKTILAIIDGKKVSFTADTDLKKDIDTLFI